MKRSHAVNFLLLSPVSLFDIKRREESHPIFQDNLKSLDIPFCRDLTGTWSSCRTHRRMQSLLFSLKGITTEQKFVTPSDLIPVTVVFSWTVFRLLERFFGCLLSLMPSFLASFSPAIDFRLRFLTKGKKKGNEKQETTMNEWTISHSFCGSAFNPRTNLSFFGSSFSFYDFSSPFKFFFFFLSFFIEWFKIHDSRETHPSSCSSFYPLISWRQEKGRKKTTMTRQDQDNKGSTSLSSNERVKRRRFSGDISSIKERTWVKGIFSVWTKDRRKSNHTKSPEEE